MNRFRTQELPNQMKEGFIEMIVSLDIIQPNQVVNDPSLKILKWMLEGSKLSCGFYRGQACFIGSDVNA